MHVQGGRVLSNPTLHTAGLPQIPFILTLIQDCTQGLTLSHLLHLRQTTTALCTKLEPVRAEAEARRLRWERPLPAEEGGGVMQHSVKVDAFPIGIDPLRFRRSLETGQVQERIEQLKIGIHKKHTSEMLADMLTKFLTNKDIVRHLVSMGFVFRDGQHELALTA